MSELPRLKAIVDAYTGAHGSNDSWVSDQLGGDRRLLWSWWNRGLSEIPSAHLLNLLAKATRTPYRDVLDAALHDFNYLPESGLDALEPPARMNRKGKSLTRKQRAEDMGLPPDEEGPEFGA